jgi:hypothetical protein
MTPSRRMTSAPQGWPLVALAVATVVASAIISGRAPRRRCFLAAQVDLKLKRGRHRIAHTAITATDMTDSLAGLDPARCAGAPRAAGCSPVPRGSGTTRVASVRP